MDLSQHWQDICHAIQEGVFLVNTSGRIVMVNEAMARLTGYSREELAGKSCTLFDCDICRTSRSQARKGWCRLFDGQPSKPGRCLIARKDGLRIPVFKNQTLLRDAAGEVTGAVETIMDLSEVDRLDRKVEELSRLLDAPRAFHGLVGDSPAMRRLTDILVRAARGEAPVLLLGESGTGKELAARALHELGGRASGPFVTLNCAALNESLLESELFGHARGAFTGAHRARRGRFEEAHGGDIFLDEIGDAPPAIQVKLLRVLETRTIERVGENRPVPVDARLITATHQDLRSLVAQGRFREDFFFRINVIPIELPPLRARLEDLPALAAHFLERMAARPGARRMELAPEAVRALMAHAWPGNVRELRNALEYAAMLAPGERIEASHLPPGIGAPAPGGRECRPGGLEGDALAHGPGRAGGHDPGGGVPESGAPRPPGFDRDVPARATTSPSRERFRDDQASHSPQPLPDVPSPLPWSGHSSPASADGCGADARWWPCRFPSPAGLTGAHHPGAQHPTPRSALSPAELQERSSLMEALRQAGGNKSRAARLLGVTRLTVHNRMRKYGLSCERVVTG